MTFEIEGKDKVGPIRLRVDADNQFEGGGRWLRGGLHSHVAQMGDPEAVCEHYRAMGFDFLATTRLSQHHPHARGDGVLPHDSGSGGLLAGI